MKQLKSERVLLDNGQFAPFPRRIEERAVATGAKEPRPDSGEEDPNLPRANRAQAELEAKQNRQERLQKEHDKREPGNAETMLEGQPTGGEKVEDPQIPRSNKAQAELSAKARKKAEKAAKKAHEEAAKAIADIIPEQP